MQLLGELISKTFEFIAQLFGLAGNIGNLLPIFNFTNGLTVIGLITSGGISFIVLFLVFDIVRDIF